MFRPPISVFLEREETFMKEKIRIGITMRLSRHRNFKVSIVHSIPDDCIRAVLDAGAMPILFPVQNDGSTLREMLSSIDGLIICGSNTDIPPAMWGEESSEEAVSAGSGETAFDLLLLRYCLLEGVPVFGICQGHEIINVALGGTLREQLCPGAVSIGTDEGTGLERVCVHDALALRKAPKELIKGLYPSICQWEAHQIRVVPGSLLSRVLELEGQHSDDPAWSLGVNSFHRFCVKDLSPYLQVGAYAEDGTIEAVEWRESLRETSPFLLGVQWHPEMLIHEYSDQYPLLSGTRMRRLFETLVSEADQFRRGARRRVVLGEKIRFLPFNKVL